MKFKEEFLDQLREQADLVSLLEPIVQKLQKRGKSYFCLSPFTDEKTASFCIDPVTQRYKDYSSGNSGDAINFIMQYKRLEFPEAVEELANTMGIPIEYADNQDAELMRKDRQKEQNYRKLLEESLSIYQKAFEDLPKTHPAKLEWDGRAYSDSAAAQYQIGFAEGNQLLFNCFNSPEERQLAQELGLIGDKHDKYWNRLIYPIYNRTGKLVGFAGRDLSQSEKSAKWINPVESFIYKKHKILFGLDKALNQIAIKNELWLVEGYNDVISFQTNGLLNSVATVHYKKQN